MVYILKSRNFVLRPYKRGDEESLTKNINDRYVYRYTLRIPYPFTLKDAKKWVNRCIRQAKKPAKSEINFTIDIDGEASGGIGLRDIEKHKAEIGYWLAKKYWGKEIVTEAVRLVTNFAFRNLKLKRLYAPIFIKNRASARVLEKNNFKKEGVLRKHYLKDGKFFDCIMYAKVR